MTKLAVTKDAGGLCAQLSLSALLSQASSDRVLYGIPDADAAVTWRSLHVFDHGQIFKVF